MSEGFGKELLDLYLEMETPKDREDCVKAILEKTQKNIWEYAELHVTT